MNSVRLPCPTPPSEWEFDFCGSTPLPVQTLSIRSSPHEPADSVHGSVFKQEPKAPAHAPGSRAARRAEIGPISQALAEGRPVSSATTAPRSSSTGSNEGQARSNNGGNNQKDTNSRDSMLSLAGASAGAEGFWNAVWIERRAGPSKEESKVLMSSVSSGVMAGYQYQR